MTENCTLCRSEETREFARANGRVFFDCKQCDLKFVAKEFKLSEPKEKQRYDLHQNDIHDPDYQKFVEPLISSVKETCPAPAQGLDYGCGPGPVTAHLLKQEGYEVTLYDPFYYREESVLERSYDFVICSEAAEHFFEPQVDFNRLTKILRPKGSLFLMTLLWKEGIRFEDWYYPRDPTHVSFYSRKTFEWIRKNFGFLDVEFRGERVVVLKAGVR